MNQPDFQAARLTVRLGAVVSNFRVCQRLAGPAAVAAVVKAVAPKPVNLLIGASGLSVKEAADLGVRRVSVGGSLARTAWAGFMRAAKEIAEQGTFTELAKGYPGGELNKMFR